MAGSELESVQSLTSQAYPGVIHERTLIRAGECFVVRDELRSAEEHTYDFLLRSEGRFSLLRAGPARMTQSKSHWVRA